MSAMDDCCDLQVDVNGEGVFMVNKGILSSYCGKLSKLFGNGKSSTSSYKKKRNHLKVIFHNFPGGVLGFELIARFCYNNGRIAGLTPSNITLLHCASQFMEMDSSVSGGTDNLSEQIVKSLDETSSYYTWSDLVIALSQTQDPSLVVESFDLAEKFLAAVVGRITLTASTEPSPCPSTSSPESSGFRVSCDSRSTDQSLKTSCSRSSWWFEDLLVLNPGMIETAVKFMSARKFDHALIGRFLLYYQKLKSQSLSAASDDRCRILETVIDNLCSLDHGSVSCKGLFMLIRASSNLNINKQTRMALEALVGSRLDEATLDNLLMAAPNGVKSLYDVDLVLRLLRIFRNDDRVCKISSNGGQMKKVADLLDLFLAEVAPDPYLKPSKLVALAVVLPDSARESYDEMYHAIDMYLQVHTGLSEEERLNVCCVLNYEKLSSESCLHLSQNSKFTSRTAVQTLVHHQQQSKLKDLLQEEPVYTPTSCYDVSSSPFNDHTEYRSCTEEEEMGLDAQLVLYAGTGEVDAEVENEKLRAQLKGMQWRVMELEKVCRKMQSQMTKISKTSRRSSGIRTRSLPKLCS